MRHCQWANRIDENESLILSAVPGLLGQNSKTLQQVFQFGFVEDQRGCGCGQEHCMYIVHSAALHASAADKELCNDLISEILLMMLMMRPG